MERYDSFGEWLRQRRRALDLTRAELGQRAGYSVSGLRKVEADDIASVSRTWIWSTLVAICRVVPPPQAFPDPRGTLKRQSSAL
jgi:DNA-binding XRE family transcriptional regulator